MGIFPYKLGLPYVRESGFRIPESMNLSLLDSGIMGFGIRNQSPGILDPANDWNPESRSLKIHSRWYYATKLEAIDSHHGKII